MLLLLLKRASLHSSILPSSWDRGNMLSLWEESIRHSKFALCSVFFPVVCSACRSRLLAMALVALRRPRDFPEATCRFSLINSHCVTPELQTDGQIVELQALSLSQSNMQEIIASTNRKNPSGLKNFLQIFATRPWAGMVAMHWDAFVALQFCSFRIYRSDDQRWKSTANTQSAEGSDCDNQLLHLTRLHLFLCERLSAVLGSF